ncbi:ANR family transcriptional regulator [Vibrio crassostreae]|uniref:ANR family transcriptional regulator n=1 Tax=Vibrio crassostreae TaxID=246167 RepID=UPI001B31050A|nr:ANR family transcriptional regulator [Vibrio crassostreae]CAK2960956.1 Tetratricopeptide repeat protein [Vibrio crassostreae]
MIDKIDLNPPEDTQDPFVWHTNIARQLERAREYTEAALHWKKAARVPPNDTNLLWVTRRANFCFHVHKRAYLRGDHYV